MRIIDPKLCKTCGAIPQVCRGVTDYGRVKWWRVICKCGNYGPDADRRTTAILEWNRATRARKDRRFAADLARC